MRCTLPVGRVIGAPVTAGTLDSLSREVHRLVQTGARGYVCVANVHMVTTARREPGLLAILERALAVTSDGMPLVWELRRQGFSDAERVYGPDLTIQLCQIAEAAGTPVYFYGGGAPATRTLVAALGGRFPELNIAGWEAPPSLPPRPTLDEAAAGRIADSGARIVFVGLGCPKQEYWMAAHTEHLPCVMIGVGAAFDFLSGAKPNAPDWMKRGGMEWLFRLASEPGRLWKRYLVTNLLFLYYLLRERVGRKGRP